MSMLTPWSDCYTLYVSKHQYILPKIYTINTCKFKNKIFKLHNVGKE